MSEQKKRGLGRGLSALFGDEKSLKSDKTTTGNVKTASISDLIRNKYQPRMKFDEDKIVELSKSSNTTILDLSFLAIALAAVSPLILKV